MDLKLFYVHTYDWGYSRGAGIERPGLDVSLTWDNLPIRRWRIKLIRYIGGFRLEVGPAVVAGDIRPELWLVRTVRCAKCGRLWPADMQSPSPGDPAWNNITLQQRSGFQGQWERDVDRVLDGKLLYKPYHWLGSCCELDHSGDYGYYDEDEPAYDYWDDD